MSVGLKSLLRSDCGWFTAEEKGGFSQRDAEDTCGLEEAEILGIEFQLRCN